MESTSASVASPSKSEPILRKLEAAKDRYAANAGGGEFDALLTPPQRGRLEAALIRYRDNTAVKSAVASAVSIGGSLCASVGVPRLMPGGEFDMMFIGGAEQLLFDDAIDIALDLSVLAECKALEQQRAMREAEAQAERDRIESQRALLKKRVQAARDARWGHITPVAAAAFRLAAKHPGGAIGELARALIATETEPRRGEVELPEELDALLWRLTADKLTNEERELVGLTRR